MLINQWQALESESTENREISTLFMEAEKKSVHTQHREFIDKPFRLNSAHTHTALDSFFAEIEFIFMSTTFVPFILFSFIQAEKTSLKNYFQMEFFRTSTRDWNWSFNIYEL